MLGRIRTKFDEDFHRVQGVPFHCVRIACQLCGFRSLFPKTVPTRGDMHFDYESRKLTFFFINNVGLSTLRFNSFLYLHICLPFLPKNIHDSSTMIYPQFLLKPCTVATMLTNGPYSNNTEVRLRVERSVYLYLPLPHRQVIGLYIYHHYPTLHLPCWFVATVRSNHSLLHSSAITINKVYHSSTAALT